MTLPDFTTIVAVDAEHSPELAAAWPTWVKWRPEILRNPILIVVDEQLGEPLRWVARNFTFLPPKARFVPCGHPADWPQRERMLTGLVSCVEHVTTSYFLKLDTDTVAMNGGPDGRWWRDEWFTGDAVLAASGWPYTKPASYLDCCDQWWESFPSAVSKPGIRGNPPSRRVVNGKAFHPRIISYVMWGRTEWTLRVWRACSGRLPCPSQDTTLWYAATRGEWPIIRCNQKQFGWSHCGSSLRRVRERAAEALK
jgi:hypothetical protein